MPIFVIAGTHCKACLANLDCRGFPLDHSLANPARFRPLGLSNSLGKVYIQLSEKGR